MCVNEMLPHTSGTAKSSSPPPNPIHNSSKPWLPQGRTLGPLNERNYVFTNPNSFKAFRNFRLFEFWNDNGSSVRDVMVASCAKQLAGLSKETAYCSSSSSSSSFTPSKDDSLLIFTTGFKTFTPHQIGVKRITPDIMKQKHPLNRNGFTASTPLGAFHHGLHHAGPGWNVGGWVDASDESDNEQNDQMKEPREKMEEEEDNLEEQGQKVKEHGPVELVPVEEHDMVDEDEDNNADDGIDVEGDVEGGQEGGIEVGANDENQQPPLEEELDPWDLHELQQLQYNNAPIQVAPVGAPPFEVPFHAYSRENVDKADKLFEMHGHVIGLTLSPDHRLLFVNVRGWPFDAEINEWHKPPDISEVEPVF